MVRHQLLEPRVLPLELLEPLGLVEAQATVSATKVCSLIPRSRGTRISSTSPARLLTICSVLYRFVRPALARFNSDSDNQDGFIKAAYGILRWGGVTKSNYETLLDLGGAALSTFREASHLLDPSHANTLRLNGVRYMNAGWTKVYALMLDGFPIYDGRVGAAMGYLVQRYCVSANLCQVPTRLRFRWGAARGRHNRNPSTRSLRFPGLTAANPRTWAECNLRLAWILGEVCREGRFGNLVPHRQLRALEAALFMIGYELPPA